MMLRPDQLPGQLKRGDLAQVYLLAGDETLLVQEAADQLRAAARQAGYDEREVLYVDSGFDWSSLARVSENLSLFSRLRLIELRLISGRIGDPGSRALRAYVSNPPPDTVMLISAGALEKKVRNAAWFKAVDRAGVCVYAWPLKGANLARWIADRLRSRGLGPGTDLVRLLIERTEGNLLACSQEIDKLALLFPDAAPTLEAAASAVADSARFDVFDLPDRVLAGDARGALRRLDRLHDEGVEPALILWALARDLRVLVRAAASMANGTPQQPALIKAGAWKSRLQAFSSALSRFDNAAVTALLERAHRVDLAVKGVSAEQPWEELLTLCVCAAGVPLSAAHACGRV